MFARLGTVVYRRRWTVIGTWMLVLILGVVASGPLTDRVTAEFTGSDRIESARVQQRLSDTAPTGGDIAIVIDGVRPAEPIPPPVAEALTEIAAVDGVVGVTDPWTTGLPALSATDGGAALVVVSYVNHLEPDAEHELANQVQDLAHALEAEAEVTEVLVGGEPIVLQEFSEQAEEDLLRGEAVALPVAFLAMIVIFGGLRAAGMPLAVAVASFLTGGIALLGATYVVDDISVFALNVISMFGIGLGIDYGLLMVSRFREERGTGATVGDAVTRTVATAGVTVVFSALTVAVAMSGMFAFGEPMMTSFGIAGLAAVLFSMAAALTLLPALLGVTGAKIRPIAPKPVTEGGFFRLSRVVQRFALPVVVVVGGGLVLLATPFLDANLENGDARSLPRSSEARDAALTLADRFPARGAEPIIVIADVDEGSPEAGAYVATLSELSGVAGVQVRSGFEPGTTVVEVVPEGLSQGEVAMGLVDDIRSLPNGVEAEVGGIAAATLDTREMIADRLPVAAGVVMAATLVLLFLMTGSIAIPIKAVIMNVASLGASFGALVWVFQDGNLSSVLAFDPVGSVDLWLPPIIFLFAFGLSMDYEVFLLSRIKEIHDRTGDNDYSVSAGLQKSGRIITSAALLIVVVFAGFAAGETLTIKQLGIGMALAVVVDASIVRSLLVPATMKLLGEWNWWAPGPMRRFHQRFGLHEPPSGPHAHDGPTGEPTGPGDRRELVTA